MILTTTLVDYMARHYCKERPITAGTIEQIDISVRLFARSLGRPPTLDDLNDGVLNDWLTWLDSGRSRYTIRKHRTNILGIWRDAFQAGRLDTVPLRVRLPSVERKIPEAWTVDEIRRLLETAKTLDGCFRDFAIRRGWYWPTLILGLWDTGLRIGDILGVQRPAIAKDGRFRVLQQKTKRWKDCRLRPSTIAMIDAGLDGREYIWSIYQDRKSHNKPFRQLVGDAGIRTGTTRWIRRSAASYVELDNPGTASEFLGHKDRTIADRHYIDPTIARPTIRQPREL